MDPRPSPYSTVYDAVADEIRCIGDLIRQNLACDARYLLQHFDSLDDDDDHDHDVTSTY